MSDYSAKSLSYDEFSSLSYPELFSLFTAQQQELSSLKIYVGGLEQQLVEINGQLVILRHKLYGKSSEKDKKNPRPAKEKNAPVSKKKKRTKLSEKYDLPILEQHVEFKELPPCPCCPNLMKDSGMMEESEFLHVIPAQFMIIRQLRHKYRCTNCHGTIKTAPAPQRIIPGSAYSDEMIQDVALSKYCDLIPIDRYSSIAGRSGAVDLPPNSLIGLTHGLAEFCSQTYEKLKTEVNSAQVLHADETPHKMLEGDKKNNWYLWGFSTKQSCYFEIRDSRSGDVASEFLNNSNCTYLMSDVYTGYQKAVRDSNLIRSKEQRPLIQNIYCNAHARRKFKEAEGAFPEEAAYFIEKYAEIYQLEEEGQKQPEILQDKRTLMAQIFLEMKSKAEMLATSFSEKSAILKAANYFLNNYTELSLFLTNVDLPIDNNLQERLLRSPVVGRKTWFGTHSKRGAKTAAVLFSLVESCKLNKVNPRQYFKSLVDAIHNKKPVFTPREYIPPP